MICSFIAIYINKLLSKTFFEKVCHHYIRKDPPKETEKQVISDSQDRTGGLNKFRLAL